VGNETTVNKTTVSKKGVGERDGFKKKGEWRTDENNGLLDKKGGEEVKNSLVAAGRISRQLT
jgi:hypothetical protein